jgi:hypothetical protein
MGFDACDRVGQKPLACKWVIRQNMVDEFGRSKIGGSESWLRHAAIMTKTKAPFD